MTDPNQPFETTTQSPSDQPNTSPSTEPVGNQLLSQAQQESYNIFNEIIDDITNKKDLDVILGVVALAMAVVTLIIQYTSSTLINMVLYVTPALSGWVLHAGYTATGKNQKTKLFLLGGISLGLSAVSLYIVAGLIADIRDIIRNILRRIWA